MRLPTVMDLVLHKVQDQRRDDFHDQPPVPILSVDFDNNIVINPPTERSKETRSPGEKGLREPCRDGLMTRRKRPGLVQSHRQPGQQMCVHSLVPFLLDGMMLT